MNWNNIVDVAKKHWTKITYIVPIVISFIVGVYFRLGGGLSSAGEHVLWPRDAYVDSSVNPVDLTTASHLKFSENYLTTFWTEFRSYYFKEEGDFETLYYENSDAAKDRKNRVLLKFLFQNDSHGDPLMISTIDVRVQRTVDRKFPWKKIEDVKPELLVSDEIYEQSIYIKNVGIGPALSFSGKAESQDGRLQFETDLQTESNLHIYFHRYNDVEFDYLFRDEISDKIISADDIDIIDIDEQGKLRYPILLEMEKSRKPGNTENYEERDGVWYEKIETLNRLKQLTKIWHKEKVDITYSYYLLNGQKIENQRIEYTALKNRAGYLKTDKLILLPSEQMRSPGSPDDRNPIFEQALSMLPGYPEEHQPKGVDLINRELKINLDGLTADRHRSLVNNPDQILNPGGYVIIYLTLEKPGNGEYSVKISLNEEELKTTIFETLVPDEFKYSYPTSLKHFSFNPEKIAENK